jgi:hypothetical protein
LGEFSPIERLFTLHSGLEITEVAHIFGLLFSTVPVTYVSAYFEQKWVGLHFGRLFQKRIWSPCSPPCVLAGTLRNNNKSKRRNTTSIFLVQYVYSFQPF